MALVAPPWGQGVPSDRAPAAAASEDAFLSGFFVDWLKNDEPDLLRCKNKKVVLKKLVAVCLIYSSRLSFTSILRTCPFCSAFWWFFPDCMVIPFL